MNKCSIEEIKEMTFDKHISSREFYDGEAVTPVSDWTELSIIFTNWLLKYKYLTPDKLPIPNHAGKGKYLINNKPNHEYPEKDGEWKKIGEYHIDTKYNADSHIKNMLSTLQRLGVNKPNIYISFHY